MREGPRRWPGRTGEGPPAVAAVAVAAGVLSVAVAAAVGLYVGRSGGAGGGGGDGSPGDAARAAYVGRQACAECHADADRLWSGSHHDLAMQPATDGTVRADFDGTGLTAGGVTWTFFRQNGRFMARTVGLGGVPEEYEVAYTFGAAPLQQYLAALPGGRYQALNVAWDTRPGATGGERWYRLLPEIEADPDHPLHWTRLSQNWNTSCAECHSTGLARGFDPQSATYETTWSDIDVACEACHGPGSEHVARARSVASAPTGGTGPDRRGGAPLAPQPPGSSLPTPWAIVRNGPGSPREWTFAPGASTVTPLGPPSRTEIESCAACHSRRAVLGGERTPEQPLLDTHVPSLLREDLYYADGQILDEVYVYGSFVQSRMYAAGVSCTDCHDPHSLELRAEGNALCSTCHRASHYDATAHHLHEPGSEGARCVGCHMPATTYMQVDPRRDHGFRIPRPDLSDVIGVPNACTGCHTDRSDGWAARAIAERHGPPDDTETHFSRAIHAGRRRVPAAGPDLARVATDAGRLAIVRGTALALLVAYPATVALPPVEGGIDDKEPLVRLGALRALEGRPAPVLARLAGPRLGDSLLAVRIQAARLLAGVPPTTLAPGEDALLDDALGELERVRRANADHPSSWVELGDLYALRGRTGEAEAAYRTALRVDSTFVAAYVNLADLLRALGRGVEEEEVLARALAAVPSAPEVLHAIGLSRVRRGDLDGASTWLARAARAAPDVPRFAYVHGVALASTSSTEDAIRVLRDALERHPFDRDLLTALATYSREMGEREAALAYAEQLGEVAPDDPGVRALVRELRGGG